MERKLGRGLARSGRAYRAPGGGAALARRLRVWQPQGAPLPRAAGQPLSRKISQGALVFFKVISSLSIYLILDARVVISVDIEQGSASIVMLGSFVHL